MDVWRIDLSFSGPLDPFRAVLDEQEKVRASRFRFEALARHYVLAHAATRVILASYGGMRPEEPIFECGAYGKSALVNLPGVVFNLSHSGTMALCAVAGGGEIGVDVEQCREIGGDDMAKRFFSAAECRVLESLTAEQKMEGFFSCWTRKEAYIKAKGMGLSLPLDAFSVECRPDTAAALTANDFAPEDVARFRLWDLPVGPGYKAALAYCGSEAGPPRQRVSDFLQLAD